MQASGVAATYFENPLEATEYLVANLCPGDLFITMGAGDNWQLGRVVYEHLKTGETAKGKDPI